MQNDLRFVFYVDIDDAGARLDRYLSQRPELAEAALSRTRLKKLIEDGCVTADGAALFDPSGKVAAGARICVAPPPPAPADPLGEHIPLTILYEDEAIIIVDKPAGLVVHPAPGHRDGTLVNALIAHCGDSLSGIGGILRPGIVHRLDKETSGVMAAAKSDAAHQKLAALFADHGRSAHFIREYQAVAWSAPPQPRGTIDAALSRHPRHREKIAIASNGRTAITHWRVMERFAAANSTNSAQTPAASLIACRLETGRTHQIRAHLCHMNCPVIGDPLYGQGFRTKAAHLPQPGQDAARAFPRQALHAARLEFPHPITGEPLAFSSAPPQDMQNLLAALRSPKTI